MGVMKEREGKGKAGKRKEGRGENWLRSVLL